MFPRKLIAVLSAALLISGCTGAPTAPPTTPAPTAPSASQTQEPQSPTRGPPPEGTQALVYFMIEIDAQRGPRLAREPREIDPDNPIKSALEAMIAGPVDPDYSTPWPKGTRVLEVSQSGDEITVNLSSEARKANVGACCERVMVHQLVWTATEVSDPEASVMILIDGQPAGETWGHMSWDKAVKRGDPLEDLLTVSIDSLAEGAKVSSPLTVTGQAIAFEATLPWVLKSGDGSVIKEEVTYTLEGQQFSPWRLTLELEPGSYVLEMHEDDPSGGDSGFAPDVDTRAFTVV